MTPPVTEHRNPRTADIDLVETRALVALLSAEDRIVADTVAAQGDAIATVIDAVTAAFRAGGRLFYVGAGTSGRLGVLDASEMPPTFGVDPDLVQGIIAGGPAAVFRSQEGAEDLPENGAAAIDEHGVTDQDCLVGIAASGTTPFVRGALARAEQLGARTMVVACTPLPAEVTRTVDVAIVAVTGPEVVTGSTRLKAGTATKMILNMITTGAMICLGKTWGNLMVDLQGTNLKLKDRSERILMESCHVSRDDARSLLEAAGGSVKVAIVMHRKKLSRAEAIARIADAGGLIRRVVGDP
jgi:N-acetylmuramic acid 6-phosphate etherase